MRTRYLALLGDGSEAFREAEKRAHRCSELEAAFFYKGGSVFLKPGSDQVAMATGTGFIVGCLFDRSNPAMRVHRACSNTADNIDCLLSEYWGGYVAIVETTDKVVHVLRDPSGAMPCFYIEFSWGVAVASDVDILFDVGLLRPQVNWAFIAKHLQASNLCSEMTGLVGLKELQAGTSLSLSRRTLSVRQCWSPWDFVAPAPGRSSSTVPERLRETVTGCVQALAGCYDGILLGVSGGLDSSIVASALSGRDDVSCYTMATAEIDGDERVHARTLAEALGLSLREVFYDIGDVDLLATNAAHLPYPMGTAIAQCILQAEREIAEEYDVDALFGGGGGDGIFCFMQSASPLVDIVRTEGLTKRAFRTLSDICNLNDCSYWAAIAAALKRWAFKSPKYNWARNSLFLSDWLIASGRDDYLSHPWLDAPRGALPGKAAHVAKILGNQMLPDFSPWDRRPQHLLPASVRGRGVISRCR